MSEETKVRSVTNIITSKPNRLRKCHVLMAICSSALIWCHKGHNCTVAIARLLYWSLTFSSLLEVLKHAKTFNLRPSEDVQKVQEVEI